MTVDALKILNNRFDKSRDTILFKSLDNHSFDYGIFLSNAKKLAERWKMEGVKKGETISFILPNSVALSCCYLSCAIGGFVACPIGDYLSKEMVNTIFSIIKPTLIVKNLPDVDETLKTRNLGDCFLDIDQDSPFIYFFSSGTMGDPKIICHSLRSVVGCANAFAHLSKMSSKTRLYHILPMTYMAGFLNTMLAPLVAGGSIVEGPVFSPSMAINFWQRPLEQHVNTLSITPTIAAALCQLTRSYKTIEDVKSNIFQVQSTSAPIHKELRRRFFDVFSIPLQDCYGITELGGPLSFQNLNDAQSFNDLSDPLPDIDISTRGELEQKELWIRSPFAMLGYLEDGTLIRPFDDNGFMDTGDLTQLNSNKINIVGRKKDIIIRGGVNISPARIENVISSIQGIKDVVVVGLDHYFWGEQIVACILESENNKYNLKEKLMEHCSNNLAIHEIPDHYLFVEYMPRSFIGKVQKNVLQKMILSQFVQNSDA